MERIRDILDNLKEESKARIEREFIIDMFLKELNKNLKGRRAFTFPRVAKMLKDSKVENRRDLYEFYNQCRKADNFGAWFNWSLKASSKIPIK